MLLWVGLGLVTLAVVIGTSLYNSLVRLRVHYDTAWADVEAQLKRRHDLIPSLVEAVKGYVGHERGLLQTVTEMRSRAMAATTPADASRLEGSLSQALRGVYLAVEGYPQLKASENVLSVQQALAQTEEAISRFREAYNAGVRDLNTRIQTMPSSVVARLFGFQPREFFTIEDAGDRVAPPVRF